MKNLKIALLHYSSAPVVGGVEKILHEQCSLFRRYFHPVKIFSGNGDMCLDKCEVEFNPLLSSCNDRVLKLHKNLLGKREELYLIINEISDYLSKALKQFDVLIAHNVITMHYNLPLTYSLHQLANSGQIKVVSWNHDSPYFYNDFPNELLKEPWDILKKYNSNVYYITISESRRQQFYNLYDRRNDIKVIPNGIDPIRFFRFNSTILHLIQENDLFNADFLMVQPCRLHPRKNIELSIRVIKALQEKGIDARLLCTGALDSHEGKSLCYYHRLKKLAHQLKVEKDILIIAEYFFENREKSIPDSFNIRDLYLIADILFMPSMQEGFGVPLLEAGINKLPIFCSDIPPFREIGNESVGYFYLKDSPEEIADKILDFINTFKPYKMFRQIMSKFLWDSIYHQKLLPFLDKITN